MLAKFQLCLLSLAGMMLLLIASLQHNAKVETLSDEEKSSRALQLTAARKLHLEGTKVIPSVP